MEELNLLPVMNLFVVLIPFLLAAAAFYHVSVVPTSTPQHTPGDSSQEADLDAVTVTVTVETERFVVTAANSSIAFDELDALGFEVPKGAEGYDVAELQAQLKALKAKFPKSTTAIVVPHDALDYQTLIGVLDGLRELPTGPNTSEPLFPVTVFSQLVPPDPVEEGAEGAEGSEGAPGEPGAAAPEPTP